MNHQTDPFEFPSKTDRPNSSLWSKQFYELQQLHEKKKMMKLNLLVEEKESRENFPFKP